MNAEEIDEELDWWIDHWVEEFHQIVVLVLGVYGPPVAARGAKVREVLVDNLHAIRDAAADVGP